MQSLRLLIVAAATAFAVTCASAQVWTRDPSFAPALHNDIPALTNTTLAPAADGRVLAWGSFTHLGDGTFASRGLAYLRADGTPDPSFVSGVAADDAVCAAAPLGNGLVLAQILHNGVGSIVRFLANGQIDPTYTPLSADYRLNLTVQPDGGVLAWANYVRIAGTDRNHLARFKADGTLDSTFVSGLPTSTANIGAVAAQSDGKLYVSTYGQSYNWTSLGAGRLVRLNADGSIDATYSARDVSDAFSTLAVQSDGKLLAGAGKEITRFAADGSADATFAPAVPNLQKVERILVRKDGEIVVQAQIGSSGMLFPSDVLLISATGAVQRDLGATLIPGETLYLAAVENDGALLVTHGLPLPVSAMTLPVVGVSPSTATPTTATAADTSAILPWYPLMITPARAKLARVAADAGAISSADPGILLRNPGYVSRAFIDSDSRIVVTGSFTDVSGNPRSGIARFSSAGVLDPSFAPNLGEATAIDVLLYGGDGSTIVTESDLGDRGSDGFYQRTTKIVRIRADGTVDTPLNVPAADVHWHAIGADGRILVSYFTPDNAAEANLHLRWLNANGTVAATLPTQFAGLPQLNAVIAVTQDASAVAGATTIIAAGNTLPPSASAPASPSYANGIGFAQPLSDGHILIGGQFTGLNGTAVPGLGRLNADGSLDASYKPDLSGFSGTIYSSSPDSDGRVVVSGQIWEEGQLVWSRRRFLANGQRDPSYVFLQVPSTVTAVRWLDNGLPDLNFPTKITQADGTTAPIYGTLTASDGSVWTTYPLARFTASDVASITVPPSDQSVIAGHSALFLVGIGTRHTSTYQWSFEGNPIAGATLPFLQLTNVQPSQAGRYRVAVTVDGQTLTSTPAVLTVIGGASRIVNFSALTTTAPGATPIAGFVIGGNGAARTWLVRAMGPSLSKFGVTGTVDDPQLDLFSGSSPLAHDAGGAAGVDVAQMAQQVGAFPVYSKYFWYWLVPPTKESAVVATLAPGGYTVQSTSASGSSGTTLLEVYDSIPGGASGSLRNVSIRSKLGGEARTPILGFVIKGVVPLHVLIRGVGPTLGSLGVTNPVADPDLTVYSGSTRIAGNAGWADNADVVAAGKTVGTFALPAGSRDSAVVLTLDPGAYTVSLTSDSGGSGEGMIEAYVLDPQ